MDLAESQEEMVPWAVKSQVREGWALVPTLCKTGHYAQMRAVGSRQEVIPARGLAVSFAHRETCVEPAGVGWVDFEYVEESGLDAFAD